MKNVLFVLAYLGASGTHNTPERVNRVLIKLSLKSQLIKINGHNLQYSVW